MMMLCRQGLFTLNILDDRAAGRSKATIELPAAMVGQPGDLFDKVFAFTFDVLGIQSVELRVRSVEEPMLLAATQAYQERRA